MIVKGEIMFAMWNRSIVTKYGEVRLFIGPMNREKTIGILEMDLTKKALARVCIDLICGTSNLKPGDTYNFGMGAKFAFKNILKNMRNEVAWKESNAFDGKSFYREVRDKFWKEIILSFPDCFAKEAYSRLVDKK
jgi:hypothetical protein